MLVLEDVDQYDRPSRDFLLHLRFTSAHFCATPLLLLQSGEHVIDGSGSDVRARSVLDAVDTAIEDRSARQHQLAFWTERQLPVDEKNLAAALSATDRKRRDSLKRQLAELATKGDQLSFVYRLCSDH